MTHLFGCYRRKLKKMCLLFVFLVMVAIKLYSKSPCEGKRVGCLNSGCVFVPQADLQLTLGNTGYIVFGVILFVWELLPTTLLVFFFRVRQPDLDRVSQANTLCPAVEMRHKSAVYNMRVRGHKINLRGHKIIYRKADKTRCCSTTQNVCFCPVKI